MCAPDLVAPTSFWGFWQALACRWAFLDKARLWNRIVP